MRRIIILALFSILFLSACDNEQVFCTDEAKLCPDGSYVSRNSELDCEFDHCPEYCIGEGESIPVIQESLECCEGLTLISPKNEAISGSAGYCTSKCGNEICDEIESNYNCPDDCENNEDSIVWGDGICEGRESVQGCDPPLEDPGACEGVYCPQDCPNQ